MSGLGERLAALREGAKDRIPGDVRTVMARATRELRESGIADRAPSPGERAPLFARPTPEGETVRLGALLERGPVVLGFFRGRW